MTMRKTLATLLAIPMLLFGVAFAADLGGSMDQPGDRSDTGVESSQTRGDSSSAIDRENSTEASGDEYKAPEASAKSGLPDWLQPPDKGESPDASPFTGGGGGGE